MGRVQFFVLFVYIRMWCVEIYPLFISVRFKLSVIAFVLIALITTGSSFIVTGIMDRFIVEELITRGFSIGNSAATAAGYSLLSDDQLALDNLTAKLKELHDDVVYVAVVDNDGKILGHSELGMAGNTVDTYEGDMLSIQNNGAYEKIVERDGTTGYEFRIPILFAEKRLGVLFLHMGTDTLIAAQSLARRQIVLVSIAVLIMGAIGVFFLSTFITTPIKNLSEGLTQLSEGKYRGEIRIVSRDELGKLTRTFNDMARLITEQKTRLEHHSQEIEDAYISTIKVLATAIDARDPHTLGHSARVASLSKLVGQRIGLNDEELKDLEMACFFHDVGKIRTPDYILHKEELLTPEEYTVMLKHVEDGADIIGLVDSLRKHIPAIRHHHEWYNGEGYPAGLRGDEIPLFASILSLTDAFDAMTSTRPYKGAKSIEEAVQELRVFKGKQFNPYLTDILIEVLLTPEINIPTLSIGV